MSKTPINFTYGSIPDWEPFTIIERSSRGSFFFAAHSPDAPEEFDVNDDLIHVKTEFDKLPEALEAVGFKILRIGSEYAYEFGEVR